MTIELPFDPFPLFPGSHQQTILGSFLHAQKEPYSETRFITLPDQDKIAVEITQPEGWRPQYPTVVMVHGLCGSHKSVYLVRMAKKLQEMKIRAIRVNLRGCGSGHGKAKKIYHSGCSEDIEHIVKVIKQETPFSDITLIGFSLGGNIVLKLAAELGSQAERYFSKVIAINPPVDLQESVALLGSSSSAFYEKYFMRMLRTDVLYRHDLFPDLPKVHIPKNTTILEFDEMYTAPFCGFAGAADYYKKCSSRPLLPEIKISCSILFSEDDPIVCSSSLDRDSLPKHIQVYKTKKGGHLGYLGSLRQEGGFHWMDSFLLSQMDHPTL